MKKLLFLLLLPLAVLAQNTKVVPDCVIPFNFTANNSTSNLTCGAPNGSPNSSGIAFWLVVYDNTGFSAVSLAVQSAPDVSGAPGTYVNFAGTVFSSAQVPGSSGVNPNTATTSAFTGFAGYYPWMRVTLASITGTGRVKGNLYGFLNSTLAKAGSGSGGATVTIAGTANEITVTGVGCSGATGTCTISIPSNAIFPGTPSLQTPPSSGDNSNKLASTNFFTGCVWLAGAMACPSSITSGLGSGSTGAFDLVGKTSGATSTITVDDSNVATQVKIPNDATSGLYAVTSPSATPAAGCAQYSGTSTEATSTGSPCGSGGGGSAGATLFSTTGSTTVTATSPTTLIGTVTGSTTVPVNTFTAGQVLEVAAQGYYSTPGTPASLTIALNIGGTTRITTGVVLQQPSVTTDVWRIRCVVTTRTAGASGTQIANCLYEASGSAPYASSESMQTSSTWTIDTTATQAIDLVATWSTATGAPTITSTNVAAWIPGAPVTSVNGMTGAVTVSGGGSKISYGPFASFPSSPSNSDMYVTNDSPHTFLFNSGASKWVAYDGLQGPPLTSWTTSGFTWANQNSWAATTPDQDPILACVSSCSNGSSGDQIAGFYSGATLTIPYTYTAHMMGTSILPNNPNIGFGIVIKQSSNSNLTIFAVFVNSSNAGNTGYIQGSFFNSETSGGSGLFNVAHSLLYSSYGYWLRIKNDSTNRVYSYSLNGIDFQPIFSEATGTRITENTFGVGVYLAFNATVNAGQVRVDSLSVTNP